MVKGVTTIGAKALTPMVFDARMSGVVEIAVKQSFNTTADAEESKVLGVQVFGANPEKFPGIVGGTGTFGGEDVAAVEHVDGMYQKTRVFILVGDGEEELHTVNIQTRLFLDLADDTFLAGLEHV